MSALLLLPLPVVALFFMCIFFYGIGSGETDHPLWQASSVFMGFIVVASIYIYSHIN